MKQSWLFLSLLIWGMIISQSLLASIFLTFVACVFHFRHFQKGHILFLILLIGAIFRIQPHTQQMPTSKIITIQEIKSSYLIGECDHQKVLLYNVKDVSFQDVIKVQGNFELIDGVHNPPEFYFPAWCKNRNIQYALDVKDYEVIKEGTGLSHDLYRYIQSKDETTRSLLNSMLFGIRQEEESYLITSSGMHITTLWQMIRSFLSLFFEKQTLELLCFFGMGIHAYATVLSPTMLRVLSFQLIRFLFPHMDMKDRLGCSMLFDSYDCPIHGTRIIISHTCGVLSGICFSATKTKEKGRIIACVDRCCIYPVVFDFSLSVRMLVSAGCPDDCFTDSFRFIVYGS